MRVRMEQSEFCQDHARLIRHPGDGGFHQCRRPGCCVSRIAARIATAQRYSCIIPGYREVLSRLAPLEIVATCDAEADLPPCTLGLSKTHDGLPVYTVICPELYER